ncbi:MAG: 30S ribosomal protein S2 [Patescibacteria group bacterium]
MTEEKKGAVKAPKEEENNQAGQEQEKDPAKISKVNKYEVSVEEMLKAGVHFGHKKSARNPQMDPYVFGIRKGISIINLEKTLDLFKEALNYIEKEIIEKNEQILIVGTKKQAKEFVRKVAEKAEMPYVNERWLGGTFTNFEVISKRLRYLRENKQNLEKGGFDYMTKLEKVKLKKELEKLEEKMGGLQNLKKVPKAVFVLDIEKDNLTVEEAKKEGVKVIALVDSNDNPKKIDYPIPANNDALSSLKYFLGVLLKRILEAQSKIKK